MSFLATAASAVGGFLSANAAAISAATTAISVGASIAGGAQQQTMANQQASASESQALQLDARAKQERAVGDYNMQRLKAANDRIRGRQTSLLAASGFSSDDVGASEIQDDTTKQASVNELLLLADAEDKARGDEFQAKLTRVQGQQQLTAGRSAYTKGILSAGGELVSGISSWRQLYGKAPPLPDPETGMPAYG